MKSYQEDTIATYDRMAPRYQTNRKGFILDKEIEAFSALLKGKNILEVGCGPGRDADLFLQKGYSFTGVDLSSGQIEVARSSVPKATFLVADVLDLPFPEASFDGIWCVATLHHLKQADIPLACQELGRVLRPGGVLFVSVKQGSGEQTVEEKEFDGAPRFFTYSSYEDFNAWLDTAGFVEVNHIIQSVSERFGLTDYYRDSVFVSVLTVKK